MISNKELTVNELFAGIGSQRKALARLGIPHRVIGISEIDKYAIKSYEAMFGETKNYGDVSAVDKLDYADFWTYSFPCFIEGTLVLTRNGYKPIEEITSNDYVLTHNNKYKKVVKHMTNIANKIYKIDTMVSESIFTTEEHPFYIRKRYKKWNNDRRMYDRCFKNPEWIHAKDLDRDCYVGTSINTESKLPIWTGSIFKWSDGRCDRDSNILQGKFNNPDFWYLIGRYIGDGWIRTSGGIIICANDNEVGQIIPKIESCELNYSLSKESTVTKIHIGFKEIGEYCEQFGRGSANKHLTKDILDLPTDMLKEFIDGYLGADGTFTQGLYKITSVSRQLMYEIGQCVAKVHHRPFSIYFTQRPKNCIIEGRIVNQRDTYQITFKLDTNAQDKAFYDDGYIWSPVNDINANDYNGLVYNLEVEDDNSYVVQNIIVHNCQDISVSGKQAGIKKDKYEKITEYERVRVTGTTIETMDGSKEIYELVEKGTRSGLLYQVERLLNVAKERGELPKYLMLENVKNLVGKKFKAQFDEWLEYLDELGYENYWQVLNAKDYGIPQNRERVFVISIRKDIDSGSFEFPKSFDNGMRLKDILETEVNESFYIAQEKVDKMLSQIKNKDTLLFDACQAKREEYFREYNDFSPTLAARDYKDPRLVNQSVNIIGKLSSSQDGVVVSQNGIAPTHTAGHGNCPKIIENKVHQVGNYMEDKNFDNPQCGRVYSVEGCSPTLNTMQDGDRQPKIVQVGNINPSGGGMNGNVYSEEGLLPTITTNKGEGNKILRNEPFIVASRGRNPDNPSDRTAGSPTEQRLEPNFSGYANTITTVQKDCMVAEPILKKRGDITDVRFGKLVAKYNTGRKQGTNHVWFCECDCGGTKEVSTGHLGRSVNSCGCLPCNRTHGMSDSRLYNIWILMRKRCNDSDDENYGGRGITVCEEWQNDFMCFYDWSIENGYDENLSIDRINNDLGYYPENCKWSTNVQQVNNRRNYGEVEYYGIVPDNTGYRAQVTVDGKKVYIAHSVNDIEFLVNERNKYIDEHNLPNKKNVYRNRLKKEIIVYDDMNSKIKSDQSCINTIMTQNCPHYNSRIIERTIESEPKALCPQRQYDDEGTRSVEHLVSDVVPTILATQYKSGDNQCKIYQDFRIRKLTPKECWRLMGFDDEAFNKAKYESREVSEEILKKYPKHKGKRIMEHGERIERMSNSQLYKQAGNSIVVDVLYHIFKNAFSDYIEVKDEAAENFTQPPILQTTSSLSAV